MVKKKDGRPSEILEAFFAIPAAEIREAIESLPRSIDEIRFTEKKFHRHQNSATTATEIAYSLHRRLLSGNHMVEYSALPPDLVLFSATLPAFEIAEMACGEACENGRLSELSEIVSSWDEGHESCEAGHLVKESECILCSVHDTVFLETLGRYGLHEYIELYENNRPLYEIRSEVGRRLIDPDLVDQEENESITADFRKQFGPDFVDEFTRRLNSHGLLTV